MDNIEDVDDLKAKPPRGGWRVSDYDLDAPTCYGGRRGMRALHRRGDHPFWPSFLGTYRYGMKPTVNGVKYGVSKRDPEA